MAFGLGAAPAVARAQDQTAVAAKAAQSADAPGRWLRAESEHFIVYSDRSETLLREYVTMLEDFDSVLRILHNRTQASTPRKLPVYLVANSRQLRRAHPEASDTLRGVYLRSLDDIFFLAIRSDDDNDKTKGDDTVLHEYTHHFMMQNFPGGYPGWMVEGLAEYYMTADLQPKKAIIGNYNSSRAYSLVNERWLPMEDILSKRPSDLERDDVQAFYSQSWLLTHYVWTDKVRRAKLQDYFEAIRAGKPAMESWTAVYGEDSKGLERNLKSYMRKSLMGVGVTRTPPTPQITFTRMPAGADDLILEAQQLKREVSREDAPALLQKVRELAAKRPDEFYSRLVLARAECDLGDRAVGEKILKTLLDERPADLEALQVLAYSRLAAARDADPDQVKAIYAEATRYLGRAHKVDDDNYLTLYGYAEARSFDREPSENTLNVIFRAAEIAPQSPQIRLKAARLFIRAGQYGVARQMLAPIAGNPHGGGPARVAANLLKELEGKADEPAAPTPASTAAPARAPAAKPVD
ncbi:hypothetical protein DMC25_05210 [Caulobacter sp. D4A]|uniref:peptidase MA family metallohydrolase n=1 Tax=unclassified Caulobacter TaxID=2648921 RepID=UPI000D733D25|nr:MULTISPECIES: hypothetical protein [unclassified Caulobacter]PXA92173.1 hypothetical protein DMC25_05210 [Caulobacter sp. D4A]PXA92598.1 hypothetical protein DMC18_10715 [Caulobacter sp. D5]